jgi:hypothetical protein
LNSLHKIVVRKAKKAKMDFKKEKKRKTHPVEQLKHLDSARPIDACVGDADAMFELGRTGWGHVLATLIDVRLDHHTSDVPLSRGELLTDVGDDEGLVAVVLGRVTVYVNARVNK